MNTLFIPMAMTGMHPARRKKKKKITVNYCFKSSCEINETLRALCWLKRSLPTFNRLFNHTQLELCVCSVPPLLNAVACTVHANRPPLAEIVDKWKTLLKTGCPLNAIRARTHQATLMTFKHHACSYAKCIALVIAYITNLCRQSYGILPFLFFCTLSARIMPHKSSFYILF